MNPTSHRSVRRAIGAFTVVGLLALGACGSDSDSNGDAVSSEEFCDKLGELTAGDDNDTTSDDLKADLQNLADIAPDGVSDDMQAFVDLFNEMDALSADQSEEAAAQITDMMDEIGELTSRLDSWSNENCPDLPENIFTEG
jgi:hypothetical protein